MGPAARTPNPEMPSAEKKKKKRSCGPHVELAANAATRITRCACGIVHVHLHAQGMSMRLDGDALRALATAMSAAVRVVDIAEPQVTTAGDGTVN